MVSILIPSSLMQYSAHVTLLSFSK